MPLYTCTLYCVGNEVSKDDFKCLEKERHQQANANPDTRTARCVSPELKLCYDGFQN